MSEPNSPFGAAQVTDAISLLASASRDFAAREAALRKRRALHTNSAKNELDDNVSRHRTASATSLNNAAAAAAEREAQIESFFTARELRIAQAATSAELQLAHSVELEKGQQIGHSQTTTLDARRGHAERLDAFKQAAGQFSADLSDGRSTYTKLRSSARSAFRGFPRLAALTSSKHEVEPPASNTEDLYAVQARLTDQIQSASHRINQFRARVLPTLFRIFPLHWIAPAAVSAIAIGGVVAGWDSHQFIAAGSVTGAVLLILFILQRIAAKTAKPEAVAIDSAFAEIVHDYTICREQSGPYFEAERQRLERLQAVSENHLQSTWTEAVKEAESKLAAGSQKLAERKARILEKNAGRKRAALAALAPGEAGGVDHLKAQADAGATAIESDFQRRIAAIEAELEAGIAALASEWDAIITPALTTLENARSATGSAFPAWTNDYVSHWKAPKNFHHAAPVGTLTVDLPAFAETVPHDPRLTLPGTSQILSAPLTLRFPDQGCLLLETAGPGAEDSIAALNAITFRLLADTPPGKLSFSIIDPVSLGQNFAGITHLADYEDSLISGRIWTGREQIEKRLAELNEHMEKVIQMYLRNEYASIYEYNERAGNISEKYHFLVVADFPAEFSEVAAKRLLSIVKSGARCGIYTLIHRDTRRDIPDGITADDLRQHATRIFRKRSGEFQIHPLDGAGITLALDPPPPAELATDIVNRVGEASTDSNRIEVPFSHIAPSQDELWTNDTTEEIRIPIGRTGATKLQYLALGKGTRQHALFAGKTGSGKSTLFHVIITNLALSCSPDQIEFYLVDFKKGVEFKSYATNRLPHAKVIAIESDREFGLSVLQRLDDELKRRGELFRDKGVQDLSGYKRAGGGPMPRTLLMIDEFQEFFVEEDRIAQGASVLLDRIVRQGRAFGIHVLLGSQTLGGAYSLARATLGQMVVRVALQCNEADAYLIMDDSNPAPRLLTRPGEGIYNDSAGAVEANSPFQTVWLPEEERDARLATVRSLAEAYPREFEPAVVFEGNAPADVRENGRLARWIANPPSTIPAKAILPLGAPNAIKGPTTAEFRSQSGNHLLIVGQRDDAVLAMFGIGLVALSAQFPAATAKFVLIDGSPPDSPERAFFSNITAHLHHEFVTSHSTDLGAIFSNLAADQKRRSDESGSPVTPTFVFINGLQRFKKLRYDDDLAFSFDSSSDEEIPSMQLNELILEGAPLGIHIIASIDSFNNVGRTMSRKALGEFEMRILFQMSANDSASLIDTPKASTLGMHRALFYNGHEGYLETFRPYAAPPPNWPA